MCASSSSAPPPALRCRTATPAPRHRSRSTTESSRWLRPRPTTTAGEAATHQRTSGSALLPLLICSSRASSRASASRGCSAGRLRDVSWRGSRISVVFPTYNERDSIRGAIMDFAGTGVIDEILVVNNNAAPGTSDEVAAASAGIPNDTLLREVHEPRQGYGYAIQRGLREATGDYIVISEPDGTFLGRDTFKLLAYVDDFDVVYGSRTARAKLMEFLFNSTNLTDVGCTMRLVRRDALARLEGEFTVGGSAFGPEMMLLSLLHGLRVIQVPVNYLPRIGVSSVTGDVRKAFALGLAMIALVLRYRLRAWFGRVRPS
ncbi:MAG: glycosyltransferase family 2 protein [Chloroflexi bacterium]|nr:MAG: glycosyltransferase family 2 protein [Chloroflexota bacterium]